MKPQTLLATLFLIIISACSDSQPLETVASVDIDKYMGRWYDIASYPAVFQKGCRCTTAEYELITGKGYVRVINRCIRFKNGESKLTVARAKAFVADGSGNARLKVQFFWPFKADYYIIGLAEDYSWAIVGEPKRKYLWILGRDSLIPSRTYIKILKIIQSKGYDTANLVKTPQNCDIEN